MSDVKDILGVGKGSGAEKPEKPAPKPKKQKMERPKGMSREAFALLGDQHPLISSQLVQPQKDKELKAKPKANVKGIPTWSFKSFKNSARTDGLELRRWTKDYKDGEGKIKQSEETDYPFAKYNKKVSASCACMGLSMWALHEPDPACLHLLHLRQVPHTCTQILTMVATS